MLNLLLGMSAAGFAPDQFVVAGGMGLYIMGVTIYARDEAGESNPLTLGLGTMVMIAGIVVVGLFPLVSGAELKIDKLYWWLLLGMLVLTNARRCLATLIDPSPQAVQAAVQNALMSIILYDAAIALARSENVAVGGILLPLYALAILALLLPAWLLGRVVYST
jgi:4-hydroxybenzoate polyprenyltransferase